MVQTVDDTSQREEFEQMYWAVVDIARKMERLILTLPCLMSCCTIVSGTGRISISVPPTKRMDVSWWSLSSIRKKALADEVSVMTVTSTTYDQLS